LPEDVFPALAPNPVKDGYNAVITKRLPVMIERLEDASVEEVLLILHQILAPKHIFDFVRQTAYSRLAEKGLPAYLRLLHHEDVRVRFLTFELIVTFEYRFYEVEENLIQTIRNEIDLGIKTQMLYTIEPRIASNHILDKIHEPTRSFINLLMGACNDVANPPHLRLAAANLLVRIQLCLLTPSMREIFIAALIRPHHYELGWRGVYWVRSETLESIEKLLLHHRIAILLEVLPKITLAEDAHEVLCALLDHAFFGAIHDTSISPLPDTQLAERPEIKENTHRGDRPPYGKLYPANPTKLTAAEPLPHQREVLEAVLAIELPWMVHSNLLEKYGLPPTRAQVREMLESRK
jgi:hypothetical protein